MQNIIKIDKVKTFENKLIIGFNVPKELEKYFNENEVFIEYDFNINAFPNYILTIPAICNIIQIAWVTNTDLFVEKIDNNFLNSLESIKKVFKKSFGDLKFDSKIYCDEIINIKKHSQGIIQLYSGGLDSTATCLRNIDTNSHLSIVDFEPAGIHKDIINWAKNIYGNGSLTRTNIYSFLNRRNLDIDFGRYTEGTWWGGIQHGMGLIGLTAPTAYFKNANSIFIASTHDNTFTENWGSDPKIDDLIKWSNITISHKDYEYTRHEKVQKIIKPYIKKTSNYPLLIVCNSYARKRELHNCSKCGKCAQAIISLCLEEIDPRKCGFNVTSNTFAWIKESFESLTYFARKSDYWTWEDTYKNIPEDIDELKEIIPGTKTFLKWFKNIDFNYDDYFNTTTVMRDRPSYSLKYVDGIPELQSSIKD